MPLISKKAPLGFGYNGRLRFMTFDQEFPEWMGIVLLPPGCRARRNDDFVVEDPESKTARCRIACGQCPEGCLKVMSFEELAEAGITFN